MLYRMGYELATYVTARAEQSDIDPFKTFRSRFLDRNFAVFELYLRTGRTRGRKQLQLVHRKFPLSQQPDDLLTHCAGCTDYGDIETFLVRH
jgi:hypothetical protein